VLNILDLESATGCGSFCVPGSIMSVETTSNGELVVLWMQNESPQTFRYGNGRNSEYSKDGVCKLAGHVDLASNEPGPVESPKIMLEIFSFEPSEREGLTRLLHVEPLPGNGY